MQREIAPCGIDPATHRTTSGRSTLELHLAPTRNESSRARSTRNESPRSRITRNKGPWTGSIRNERPWTTSVRNEGRKEMFYLTTHSTHFIYGYMASDIWQRTSQIVREETRCRHMGYHYE